MRVRFEVLFLASTVASFIVVVIRLLVTEAWCLVSRVIVTSVLSSTPGWAVGPVQPALLYQYTELWSPCSLAQEQLFLQL